MMYLVALQEKNAMCLYTDAICTGAANSWYLMFDVFRFQPRYKHDSKIFYESSVLSGSLGG